MAFRMVAWFVTIEPMTTQSARSRRRLLALAVVTVAASMLAAEPFPKGAVLVSLTDSHGVDAGDLPALGLLLLAGWLAR
jgi:hypothetical protein